MGGPDSPVRTTSPNGTEGGYVMRLYIVGSAQNSLRALANLEAICRQYLAAGCSLDIVDVLQEPRRALNDGVILTPTLVKLSPLPVVRIAGDLSQTAKVVAALGLAEKPHG